MLFADNRFQLLQLSQKVMYVKNLRKLREAHNFSQQQLAEQVGVAQSQIHSYEAGLYEPAIETLKEMASVFETSVDYIIGNTEVVRPIEPVTEYSLNRIEKSLVDCFRQLTHVQRTNLSAFLEAIIDPKYVK